jgi:hypothetical protein
LLSRWFEKKQQGNTTEASQGLLGPRVPRHSGAWSTVRKRLQSESGLRVIDTGFTSPSNINYLTSLGQSIFLTDMVHDAYTENWQTGTDEEGNPIWNVEGFLERTLNFDGRMFDVVLLWTALDYLPEQFVAPVVAHLFPAMNPGGQVLAFFHTKSQGEETTRYRYHVTETDNVDVQVTQQYPIQRAFTNRSIERLFTGWSGHKQFLAKDSVSEVIITR